MNYVTELFYNVIEALLISFFINSYFDSKTKLSKIPAFITSFLLMLLGNTLSTVFNPSWQITLFIFILITLLILEICFKSGFWEHIVFSVILFLMLAITDLSVFTFMSSVFDVEYRTLVMNNDILRLFTVFTAKALLLLIMIIILSFKKKYIFYLHRTEFMMMLFTFLVSAGLIIVFRNIIYDSEENYDLFLFIVLCIIFLNIGQYYTLLFISRKNIAEKELALVKNQIKMHENNLHDLEEKYDFIKKTKHDMKHFVSCCLEMAKSGENDELINYLENLSNAPRYNISSPVNVKRKILGAVINSKLNIAEQQNCSMKCIITDEFSNVTDMDIGLILSNLLDNALEACEKNNIPSEIQLKMWSDAGYYCLEIVNTVDYNVLEVNPQMKTRKKDNDIHGIGLKSVKDIVERYDGMLNFNQESNRFYVYVSLKR